MRTHPMLKWWQKLVVRQSTSSRFEHRQARRKRRKESCIPRFEVLEDLTLLSPMVIATIPVGTTPLGVGVNTGTNRAYVANNGSGTVSVINDLTNTVVTTINLGAGSNLGAVGVNTATNHVF